MSFRDDCQLNPLKDANSSDNTSLALLPLVVYDKEHQRHVLFDSIINMTIIPLPFIYLGHYGKINKTDKPVIFIFLSWASAKVGQLPSVWSGSQSIARHNCGESILFLLTKRLYCVHIQHISSWGARQTFIPLHYHTVCQKSSLETSISEIMG